MNQEQILKRIKELVACLNEAAKAYYQEDREILSNQQYDALYDELENLEQKTGIIFSNSPTQKVGYTVISTLPRVSHSSKMLSLDKTKEIVKLKSWLGKQRGILSWKLDGLTIVLTYRQGELYQAVTRGNGEIGEEVTNNARFFRNIPFKVPFQGELIIRGEAVIKYSDFEKINQGLSEEEQYKNPRNLCSGSVRQLNNEITAMRNVNFFAFQLVQAVGVDFSDSKYEQLKWLEKQGFEIVESVRVQQDTLEDKVKKFEEKVLTNDFPADGLVLTYESLSYSEGLGQTSKFPRDSIAFKWTDETKTTRLIDVQWNTSRTGLINPVAVFEPIQLEGTTVTKASVHNLNILEDLALGVGDTIEVYKANMIIPQVAHNLTATGPVPYPQLCPACGGETKVKQVKEVKLLYCTNPYCNAKQVKSLTHFTSRNAMDIQGFSEATIEKLVDKGFLTTFGDIYRLSNYEEEIKKMEGFGEKSFQNMMKAIERSRQTQLPRFIYGLGIQNVGVSNATLLCQHFADELDAIMKASLEELLTILGFGEVIAKSIYHYFRIPDNQEIIQDVLQYLQFERSTEEKIDPVLEGKIFVITGNLEYFENRQALQKEIEKRGGKVTGSVSKNTNYLINNDIFSSSSKNQKAKQLNIPILSEEEFLSMLNQGMDW
ncbi:MAG: NAD-dependent DNA ligase LigA [Epulopiscium sp.]|nr:NAD-dependent DNA ligase LigA [Candidatus Epulonipiscium sp.]